MKKEEQIKQLKTQLAELQPFLELSKTLPKSHLANFVANELGVEIKELIIAIAELEKKGKETILDFNDVEITSYLDSFGKITDFRNAISVKSLYEDFPTTQFLGYNSNSEKYIFCSNRDKQLYEGMPTNMLYFGKKKEKQLKHPHMKDMVSIGCLTADMSIDYGKGEENIDWNEWDKVQIIGEDAQYGIVVKATFRKESPNQFSLFFCKKK